jgi:ABC-type multidrug transport system ATPase subunit
MNELHQVKDWYGPVLSDGERKRIMIIAALMKDPELLTMDEATRGIDIPTKEKVERIMKELLAKATILYTDHNPSETTFYDHRIKLGN